MQDDRYAIQRVVGGHHGLGAAFLEGRLEGFQIIFTHISRINARRVNAAVDLIIVAEEMLKGCYRFQILGMIALDPLHQ
ncbi:hypothetical protein D3C73_1602790 [compost metagenome]